MKQIRSTSRFFLLITVIEIALIAVLLMVFASRGEAHTLRPTTCEIVWHQAPPGHRWKAKQRCLAYVANHNCRAHPRPVPIRVRVKGVRADRNQRHVTGWIVNEALRRRLPRVAAVAALAATTQEASARELHHGEGSSVGPFQLISSHGSLADRITVEFSGNWFFNGAVKVLRRQPGIGAAQLSQAVEASGYPGAYSQWVPESNRTLNAILGPCALRG